MFEVSKILVIDDEGDLREILVDLFSSENLEVREAADGFSALELINSGYRPSLILCDLNMPGMTGEEFIQQMVIKSTNSLIAVLSGYGERERIVECMNLGAADFFTKPIDEQQLLDKVYLLLEIYRARLAALKDPTKSRHYENLLKIRQGKLSRARKSA